MVLLLFNLISANIALGVTPQILPEETLYSQPSADPLAPDSGLTIRSSSDSRPSVLGKLGLNQPLVQFDYGQFRVQLGLAALAYMTFENDGEFTFGLRTFDGIISVPLSVSLDNNTVTLRWLHLSSHYADGIRFNGEMPSNIEATSQETLELSIAKTIGWVTGYQRLEWRYHQVHDGARLVGGFGLDVSPVGPAVPYASAFLFGGLTGGGLSGELGLLVGESSTVRLGLSGYVGRSIAEKLSGEDDNFVGLHVAFSQ